MRNLLLWLCSVLALPAVSHTFYSLDTASEQLGQGFELESGMPKEACLNGVWHFQGGSQGDLAYRGAFDSQTMINTIAGSVQGGINLVIFGGSVKFSMRRKVTENNNSAASVVELGYEKGSYNFEQRTVKADYVQLLQTDPAAVRASCGDSFIHNVRLGSKVYLSAKLHFRTKQEYEWFQTKIKIKVLFFKKTITKTKEFLKATENAVYSVQVNTDGGMTPKLAALSAGGAMHCKTDNLDPCIDYAERLFAYLLDGGDYAQDLSDEHLNVLSYEVESYQDSGHYELAAAGSNPIPERYMGLSARLRAVQDMVSDEIERLQAFMAVADTAQDQQYYAARLAERQSQRQSLDTASDYCATLPGTTLCESRIEAAIAQVN
ncbi:hypothetical protein ACFOEE_14010 [Pseudoalteromonas fenneropenaei]|uniref:Uncharacterized protein n=1 Tax=Pseudoalteromonas fenneropenaei TaxID=1737459 RepID=A0ABV7CMB2_9GAMM